MHWKIAVTSTAQSLSTDSNHGHSDGSTTSTMAAAPGAAEKYKERGSRAVTAWWENDIQSTVRPIQAKLANDSSPPLRFREVKGTTAAIRLSLQKAAGGEGGRGESRGREEDQ
ncbi:hypothetical protein D9C73_006296 [Collichthys lucidus]|uniref:Uncharacterized protein n=1 Tax=Collichthys lucidus TaxID=240159 RepID=A0A4V6AP97_COLLU|nr:hypothetical protein D9C73_006296 [Collichthys lucidus]